MYTQEKYLSDILAFTNTLVIKLTDIGVCINNGLTAKYGIETGSEKRTWKYFLNLAGIKHTTNTDVKIVLRETGETVSLTKDILNVHLNTKAELFKQEAYYNALVSAYPDDIMYIHGCMYNLDLDTLIDMPDGTIIGYNKNYISPQESGIIPKLQKYIIGFLSRWNNSNYIITDDLYTASVLAVLYANIPAKIINLRLAKANTAEAHQFHIEQYFRSNMDMWEDVDILNQKSLYWLYANMKYILKNVGKESTLQKIITNVFEANGIGVGEYKLHISKPELNNAYDATVAGYTRQEPKFAANKLNPAYTIKDGTFLTISEMLAKEFALTTMVSDISKQIEIDSVITATKTKINNTAIVEQKTKILDVAVPETILLHGVDPLLFIMEKLIYNIATDRYTIPMPYIEPNTKELFNITPKIGVLMLFKLMLHSSNSLDVKIKEMSWEHTVNTGTELDINILTNGLFGRHQIEPIVSKVLETAPKELNNFFSVEEFNSYINKQFNFLKTMWVAASNCDNSLVSTNINVVYERMIKKGAYTLSSSESTIDELLLMNGISYEIEGNFDVASSIIELVKTLSGVDIDYVTAAAAKYEKFRNILRKLTSYSVQVINTDESSQLVFIPTTTPNFIYMSPGKGDIEGDDVVPSDYQDWHGLITVLSGQITDALEPYIFWMWARGNDFTERSLAIALPSGDDASICCNTLGLGIIDQTPVDPYIAAIQFSNGCIPWYSVGIDGNANDYKEKIPDILSGEIGHDLKVHSDLLGAGTVVNMTDRPIAAISITDNTPPVME